MPAKDIYHDTVKSTLVTLFDEPVGKLLLESERIRLVVFDPQAEEIVRWIP